MSDTVKAATSSYEDFSWADIKVGKLKVGKTHCIPTVERRR